MLHEPFIHDKYSYLHAGKKNIQKEEEENIWSCAERKEKQIRLEVLLR